MSIMRSKPLEDQISSCRDALERTETQLDKALAALAAAQTDHEQVATKHTGLLVELNKLLEEEKIAKAKSPVLKSEQDVIAKTSAAMAEMLDEMAAGAASGAVASQDIADVKVRMAELMDTVSGIAAKANIPRQATSTGSKRTASDADLPPVGGSSVGSMDTGDTIGREEEDNMIYGLLSGGSTFDQQAPPPSSAPPTQQANGLMPVGDMEPAMPSQQQLLSESQLGGIAQAIGIQDS